jgi:hypothetical protein
MSDESTGQKVKQIIDELFAEVRLRSGEVDKSGEEFWAMHYTPLFTKAIDEYGRDFEEDKHLLKIKARALAMAARRHAGTGPIMGDHAESASREVDCRRDPDKPFHVQEWWCN